MADSPLDSPDQTTPETYEFTLKIITPDGKNVYTVESAQIAQLAAAQSVKGDKEARELLDLSAPIAHVPYKGPGEVKLLGTFFINLSVYNPNK